MIIFSLEVVIITACRLDQLDPMCFTHYLLLVSQTKKRLFSLGPLFLKNSCSYVTYGAVAWLYVAFGKESKLNITQYLALCIQISWLGYQRQLS